MKKFVTVLAMALCSAAPLYAQSSFEGFYAGVGLGIGNAESVDGGGGAFTGDGVGEATGITGGVFGGYNFVNGNFVYGGEVHLAGANITGEEACINPSWTCRTNVDALGSIRGRVGMLSGADTMFYGFGGFAAGNVDLTTISATAVEYPGKETSTGYVYGIGVEHQIPSMPGMRLRAEIARYELGPTDYVNDVPYNQINVNTTVVEFGAIWNF